MDTRRFLRRRNDWAANESTAPQPPSPAPAQAPCRHCARLRIFLAGVLLAAGAIVLHASAQGPVSAPTPQTASTHAVSHPVPARPELQTTPLHAAPPTLAPASSPDSALALIYQTVPLPNGRLNQPYAPRDLARGGRAPYRFALDGALPPGMALDAAGRLSGTPTAAGSYRFQLTVTDAADPPRIDQAPYVLRILDPVPANAAPRPAKPAQGKKPDRSVKFLNEEQTNRAVGADPPMPMTYVLTAETLAEIYKNAESSTAQAQAEPARQAAGAGEAPAAWSAMTVVMGPTVDQLRAMLQPLQDVEHPTRAVFQDSLRASQCNYFLRHVNALALEQHLDLLARCPRTNDLGDQDTSPPPHHPMRSSSAAAGQGQAAPADKKLQAALATGRLPLANFLDMLMPETLREELTQLAGVTHDIAQAQPLQLAPDAGCGCALTDITSDVFAFMPYWMAAPDKGPMKVSFDKFTRLQYMGVVLRNNGEFLQPLGWNSPGGGFARQVDKHAVSLDLVLYRRDFSALSQLSGSALGAMLDKTASEVGAMLDLRHDDWQGALETLLPSGWREARYAYDGLTVFFDPTDDEARSEGFQHFYAEFVFRLVKVMEARPQRRFHLNLVLPQHLVGEAGTAFSFRQLTKLMKRAERQREPGTPDPKDRNAAAVTYKSSADYQGQGDVSMRFLVPLGVGSDTGKMQLRSRTDFNADLVGEDRMALLGSLVPVLLHAGGKAQPLQAQDAKELDRDLVYIGWSFGGVALWPLPVAGIGTGEGQVAALDARFWSFLDQDTAFCKFVCPLRLPFRLALEALLLVTGTALLAYAWHCSVRRLGKLYLMGLWGAGIATLAVTAAVFTCDPSLNALRTGNVPLLVLIVLLVVGGLVLTFRRPVADP
ncbi:putative Ig domain-containing protein [Roseateles sp. P5_D6]